MSAFKEFGLPMAIRTDNGVPFASPNALFNTSPSSRSGGCGSAYPTVRGHRHCANPVRTSSLLRADITF